MTITIMTIIITIINKILNYIKKNYKILNILFLLLSIYVILFPIIAIPIKLAFPQFGQCTYLRVTGKPCPLCGGTRYIQNLPQIFKNPSYLLHPFGVIVLFIIFEIIFRINNLIKKKNDIKLIKINIIIHIIATTIFFMYEIFYFIK